MSLSASAMYYYNYLLKGNIIINNNLHMAQKYAQIFDHGHHLFQEANCFPRAKDKYMCMFFKPNRGYCVYYPSNIFRQSLSLSLSLSLCVREFSAKLSNTKVVFVFMFNNIAKCSLYCSKHSVLFNLALFI